MNPTVLSVESPRPPAAATFFKMLFAVSLPLYVLDQVTKYLVWRHISREEIMPVIPGWFDLVHVGNTGAAWGIMHNSNWFFAVLSVFALGVLAVMYYHNAFTDFWPRAGLYLLIPGILGNLTDRLLHGHVVDFLSFNLHVPGANPWPSFNVADSCICVAVGCFLAGSYLDWRRQTAP